MKAQAMVEFALILPILLALELGVYWIGNGMWDRQKMEFAAEQGAIAGITNPADSCGKALEVAEAVYDGTLTEQSCVVHGGYLTVWLFHRLLLAGDLTWAIQVEARVPANEAS